MVLPLMFGVYEASHQGSVVSLLLLLGVIYGLLLHHHLLLKHMLLLLHLKTLLHGLMILRKRERDVSGQS